VGALRRLVMPKLGLTMTEGTVAEWPLAEGARFAKDEVFLVVETGKVANEVTAPEAGRLLRIVVPKGETVPVGALLAEWESDLEGAEEAAPAAEGRPGWHEASALELAAKRRLMKAKQELPHGCDHRVLGGVRALAFLNGVRAALEAPEALFD
jgi:pyruvate/2-oxoglutarate dehydrogenase complex dihydrolipoamide acyltransferase (E2) component